MTRQMARCDEDCVKTHVADPLIWIECEPGLRGSNDAVSLARRDRPFGILQLPACFHLDEDQ
jgi:hypothetical protein